jgi:hypothetical protein
MIELVLFYFYVFVVSGYLIYRSEKKGPAQRRG